MVNKMNDRTVEVNAQLIMANRAYYGLQNHVKSGIISRKTKTLLYKTLIRPVLTYGAETYQERYRLYDEKDIVKFCKLSRLRWAGHVVRQDDDDLARRVLLSESGGKRPRGRPRLRWEDGVKEDVAKLGCRNWTVAARNRKGWRKLLKEAKAHPRL